jgi:hypothetical protein
MTGPNGRTYVPLPWLLAVLTAAVLGLLSTWAHTVDADVDQLKHDQAVVQTNQAFLADQLKRIEGKMDLLLERGQ